MLTLYGTSRSRASRCLVALDELGVSYAHRPITPNEARDPHYLKKNPNGRFPCLEDGNLVLWESMAINLYLAETYGCDPFWPQSAADRAHACQWSFWAIAHLDAEMMAVYRAQAQRSEEGRDAALGRLRAALRVLDAQLQENAHMLGHQLTIADINVATALSEPHEGGRLAGWDDFSLTPFPAVERWLDRCVQRSSYNTVRALP